MTATLPEGAVIFLFVRAAAGVFSLGNEFSCQPKPGNLRFSGFGFRSPLCLTGVGQRSVRSSTTSLRTGGSRRNSAKGTNGIPASTATVNRHAWMLVRAFMEGGSLPRGCFCKKANKKSLKRGSFLFFCNYLTAMHSTSSFAPIGSAATAKQERAGAPSGKYLP